MGEAYTEYCAGRREFAAPESWYSFEMQVEVDEGFNVHRSQNRSIRIGKDVKGLRSHQAVACTKRCIQELGRPIEALIRNKRRRLKCERHEAWWKPDCAGIWALFHIIRKAKKPLKRILADGSMGVGSSIVLRAWESHGQGEGLDGST